MKVVLPTALLLLFVGCTDLDSSGDEADEEPKEDRKSLAGKMTREVLDYARVKEEHPDWKVVDPETSGNDPLTQSMTAYHDITHSMAQTSFQQWLRQYRVLNNDRNPAFSEVKRYVERESQGLPAVRRYDHWAYDAETGQILLVRDPEAQAAEYERRGMELPDE